MLPQPAQEGPLTEAMSRGAPLAMASTEVAQRVVAAVRTVLGADVGPEQPLVAAGLDSLGVPPTVIAQANCLQMAALSPACSSPRGCLCQARWSCATSCLAYLTLTCPERSFSIIRHHPPLPLYSVPGSLLRMSSLRAVLQGGNSMKCNIVSL